MYRSREKRGREAGEKGKNYVTLRNILQSKKCKGVGANKYRAGSGRFKSPCPPPPLMVIMVDGCSLLNMLLSKKTSSDGV